jgi:hypothetical protein
MGFWLALAAVRYGGAGSYGDRGAAGAESVWPREAAAGLQPVCTPMMPTWLARYDPLRARFEALTRIVAGTRSQHLATVRAIISNSGSRMRQATKTPGTEERLSRNSRKSPSPGRMEPLALIKAALAPI